jgi:hypothetical protein
MNAADDTWASDQQPLVRADFRKLSPLRSPAPIPPPDRVWPTTEWAAIRRGHRSRDNIRHLTGTATKFEAERG